MSRRWPGITRRLPLALVLLASGACQKDSDQAPSTNPAKRGAGKTALARDAGFAKKAQPDQEELADRPLERAPDLRLVIRRFNWETQGYHGLIVEADRKAATVVWEVGERKMYKGRKVTFPAWYRRSGPLTDEELGALVGALEAADFMSLDPEYIDPDIEDGSVKDFRLRAYGEEHTVHCSNKYPPAILAVTQAARPIEERLSKDREEGVRMDRKEMEAFWSEAFGSR